MTATPQTVIIIIALVYLATNLECAIGFTLGDCISFISQSKCPKGQFLGVDPSGRGCAQCRGGLGYGSSGCDETNECAPGLTCNQSNNTCILDKTTCAYTYHLPSYVTSRPVCEVYGTFAAKQCKGDMSTGRCFCYSEQGERIFGWDWLWSADDMTCACSRHLTKLKQEGKRTTMHCQQNGNYEELQCSDGVCWCVHPGTGEQIHGTRAVPEKILQTLPCYNDTTMSNIYLRQCDSKSEAIEQMRQALSKRGFINHPSADENCGFDGNYGSTSQSGNVVACTWYDGSVIQNYRAELVANAPPMNCYCAQDTNHFLSIGYQISLACNYRGEYGAWQRVNRRSFCVDSNGNAVSGFVDGIVHESDCNQYLYYNAY